jgi:probable HAF family extracellular repeat protein
MKEKVLIVLALLGGLGGLSPAPATAQLYSVQDLGMVTELPGGSESKPNGINYRGEVAGANVLGGRYQALVYDGASWTNLGTLGGINSYCASINDSNLVVGHSLTADGSDHAFLWMAGGNKGPVGNPQMMDLGTLGGSASEAYAINRIGQITGYTTDAANNIHAFLYRAGTMIDIGPSLGGNLPYSFGYGINDAGHIAGTAYNASYSVEHAFFYNGVTSIDLGSLGASGASALALNNNDQVVGYATTKSQSVHAFLYAGGKMTDLGTLGGDESYAIGINNSNAVVGGANFDSSQSSTHAFLAISNSMIDLNSLLDSAGAGWTLTEAHVISDSGLIAGLGLYGGTSHMFLLRPSSGVQPPVINGIERAGADILIRFSATVAARYALESTTNLLNSQWSDVLTNITATSPSMTITHSRGAVLSSRFYRLKVLIQ